MYETRSINSGFQAVGGTERRGKHRFRIELGVQCRVLDRRDVVEGGFGRTVDISSSGVLIRVAARLSPGERIALTLRWPALINEICPVNLVIEGSVVRNTECDTAVAIDRYEFRTRGVMEISATAANCLGPAAGLAGHGMR
ncbi:MAG: PilZ domain-containing protein [Bryobacteraceae bacterium]